MKNLLLMLAWILLFSSCSSTASLWYADRRMQEVSLGMPKSQVIDIMGKSYLAGSSSRDAEGKLTETLVYKSSANEEYRLKFIDGKLDNWNRVHFREYIPSESVSGGSQSHQ